MLQNKNENKNEKNKREDQVADIQNVQALREEKCCEPMFWQIEGSGTVPHFVHPVVY